MLTAFSVLIGIFCKNFLTFNVYYRLTFENLPVILAGLLYGPVVGGAVGAAADIVSCICSTNPAVNPLITFGAVCVGVSAGIVARYVIKKRGKLQFALAVSIAHLAGQVTVKSIAKMIWFAMPWYGIFIGLVFSALAGTFEFFIIKWIMNNKSLRSICGDEG